MGLKLKGTVLAYVGGSLGIAECRQGWIQVLQIFFLASLARLSAQLPSVLGSSSFQVRGLSVTGMMTPSRSN